MLSCQLRHAQLRLGTRANTFEDGEEHTDLIQPVCPCSSFPHYIPSVFVEPSVPRSSAAMSVSTTAADGYTNSPSSLTSLIQNAALSSDSPISPESLADKQVASYIRSLSNFSLTDLKSQPQHLQSKSEALHHQLSELCISQTDAFIHIHHAEQQFAPSLSTFATHLDDLIANTLPDLQAAVDAFVSASQPVLAERERIQNVADQYERGHLSDLLEIPPLVQTCVRAGHHSEAIQLAEHLVHLLKQSQEPPTSTSSSHTLHGQRSTYLSLLIETLSHLAIMKADLISSFSKAGLKLPAALKSVTILRRLSHFESSLPRLPDWQNLLISARSNPNALVPQLGMTENQLCLAFLKARIRSFYSAVEAMGSPSSFSSEAYLRRYIDLWREEMADTLGMAFPLFIDEAPSASQRHRDDDTSSEMTNPAYLVSSFATSGLQRLRDTISVQLVATSHRVQSASSASSGQTASLETLAETFANIHTQLSYASAALTRFGLDFGALLFGPSDNSAADPSTRSLSTIESTWLDALTHALDRIFSLTHAELDQNLQAHDGTSLLLQFLISSQLPASALEDLYGISAGTGVDSSVYDDLTRPNIELVDYPVIAKLLNRLLEWIHALQVFAPVNLASVLLQRLDVHFASISERLLAVPDSVANFDTATPRDGRLLADDEAQSVLLHLDGDAETKQALQAQIVHDRKRAILSKVMAMWHSSVVAWTLNVVRTQIFDLDAEKGAATIADEVWVKAQKWIQRTHAQARENAKQRRADASARMKAVEEAEAQAGAAAEETRRKAAEEARRRAEHEARIQAEHEARVKAEEEARLKAEQQVRRQAEERARLEAEEQTRLEAEEQVRLKAEEEAHLKAKEEARIKAEQEERLRVEEEARLKAQAEEKIETRGANKT